MIIQAVPFTLIDTLKVLVDVDRDMEHISSLPEPPEDEEGIREYMSHLVSFSSMRLGANLSDLFCQLDQSYGTNHAASDGGMLTMLAEYNEAFADEHEHHLEHHPDCPARLKTEDVIQISRAQAAVLREFARAFEACQPHFTVMALKDIHRGQDIDPEDVIG